MRTERGRRATKLLALTLGLAAIAGGLAGCAAPAADHVTTLNFFQFKGEATADFDRIIAEFEAENPDIRIVQNQVADSETLIRTLLVKDRAPDIITLNANGNFGKLAEAGVFHDFSNDPVLQTIAQAPRDIMANLGSAPGEVNGLGYVNNANGIVYNREIFAQQGLQVPTTYEELIAVCEKLKAAGITPFASGMADNWTVMPSWNGLGAYAAQGGFFDEMRAAGEHVGQDGNVSFSEAFPQAMTEQAQLFSYSQDGYRGAKYDDQTALFAHGGAAMMLQGIWSLSPVRKINPDVDAGIFPYPSPEGADKSVLVSGVDVAVTLPKTSAHHEEAMRFVDFLFRPDVNERFAAAQTMFPTVVGARIGDDPVLQSVAPYFEAGRITGFIDHQVPTAVPLTGIVQSAVLAGEPTGALQTLDNEWRKVAARSSLGGK